MLPDHSVTVGTVAAPVLVYWSRGSTIIFVIPCNKPSCNIVEPLCFRCRLKRCTPRFGRSLHSPHVRNERAIANQLQQAIANLLQTGTLAPSTLFLGCGNHGNLSPCAKPTYGSTTCYGLPSGINPGGTELRVGEWSGGSRAGFYPSAYYGLAMPLFQTITNPKWPASKLSSAPCIGILCPMVLSLLFYQVHVHKVETRIPAGLTRCVLLFLYALLDAHWPMLTVKTP